MNTQPIRQIRQTKKNPGFTLIEILVVIGLIAILAATVIIAINPRANSPKAIIRREQAISMLF